METQRQMAALVPDERWVVLPSFILFLLINAQHDVFGTRTATYKVMESHSSPNKVWLLRNRQLKFLIKVYWKSLEPDDFQRTTLYFAVGKILPGVFNSDRRHLHSFD